MTNGFCLISSGFLRQFSSKVEDNQSLCDIHHTSISCSLKQWGSVWFHGCRWWIVPYLFLSRFIQHRFIEQEKFWLEARASQFHPLSYAIRKKSTTSSGTFHFKKVDDVFNGFPVSDLFATCWTEVYCAARAPRFRWRCLAAIRLSRTESRWKAHVLKGSTDAHASDWWGGRW